MNQCAQFIPAADLPPAHWSPLRASAHIFAISAGYAGYMIKIRESKKAIAAKSYGWDVYVKAPGTPRGKMIGTMLERACDEFGPYSYKTPFMDWLREVQAAAKLAGKAFDPKPVLSLAYKLFNASCPVTEAITELTKQPDTTEYNLEQP